MLQRPSDKCLSNRSFRNVLFLLCTSSEFYRSFLCTGLCLAHVNDALPSRCSVIQAKLHQQGEEICCNLNFESLFLRDERWNRKSHFYYCCASEEFGHEILPSREEDLHSFFLGVFLALVLSTFIGGNVLYGFKDAVTIYQYCVWDRWTINSMRYRKPNGRDTIIITCPGSVKLQIICNMVEIAETFLATSIGAMQWTKPGK